VTKSVPDAVTVTTAADAADDIDTTTRLREALVQPAAETASTKYSTFALTFEMVKLVPVAATVPPVAEVYQLYTVPASGF
jgi:hypothetical protein